MYNNDKPFHSKRTNGRVNILTCEPPDISDRFQMYDKIPINQCSTFRNPTEGIWNNTQLSDLFFSGKNICTIQNGIRSGVYNMSNHKFIIANQDEDTLKIIMRSVFLQTSINNSSNIKGQVNQLNQLVLDYCIPQVFGEAKGYKKYLVDVSTMYTPMPPPVFASNFDRVLFLKDWF